MYWLPGLLNCLTTLGFSKAFDLLDLLVFWVALLQLETESKPGSASTSLIALCACRPTVAQHLPPVYIGRAVPFSASLKSRQ